MNSADVLVRAAALSNLSPMAAADVPSFTIGVVVPSLASFYVPMLDAIEAGLEDEPTMLVLCNTREDAARAAWYVDQLVVKGADGIILVAHDRHAGEDTLVRRSQLFAPTVAVDWPTAPDPVVLFDSAGAGRLAAEHLVEHGHRRIGIVIPPAGANVAETRAGIDTVLTEAEIAPDLVAHVPDWTAESGFTGASELLSADPAPTAILALSDSLAIGVIQAAKSRGRRIPDDLALVRIDDIEVAAHLDPPLTTVHLAAAEAGARAIEMLCKLVAKQELDATRVVLPTHLVRRRSCGCH